MICMIQRYGGILLAFSTGTPRSRWPLLGTRGHEDFQGTITEQGAMNAWDKQLIPGSLAGDIRQPQEQQPWPPGLPSVNGEPVLSV